MNTIGTFLTNARKEKGVSLEKLESVTKIKQSFIIAIENEDWTHMPEYPVVLGFVRNIAGSLDVSVNTALALLRRDYPPKTLKISPSPDVGKKFNWSPKLTFLLGVGLFILMLIGYLGVQYFNFTSSPKLTIDRPKESEVLISARVVVEGNTETDVKLEVNNQPILVDSDGNFTGEVQVSNEATEITFKAISRSGKETVVVRKIETDF